MKYKVMVTRTDEYEIDIDQDVWNEETLKDWSSVFNEVETVEDIVEDFAIRYMRTDSYFIEGYGYVKRFYKNGDAVTIFINDKDDKIIPLAEDRYCKGLSIQPISEDYEYETDIEII